MSAVFRRPGPPLIDDAHIPEFFVETVAIVQRLPGGNARFTYCVQRPNARGRTLWMPIVHLVRPIALMSPGLRHEYADILEGQGPSETMLLTKRFLN